MLNSRFSPTGTCKVSVEPSKGNVVVIVAMSAAETVKCSAATFARSLTAPVILFTVGELTFTDAVAPFDAGSALGPELHPPRKPTLKINAMQKKESLAMINSPQSRIFHFALRTCITASDKAET
jgi:hypothetical protein